MRLTTMNPMRLAVLGVGAVTLSSIAGCGERCDVIWSETRASPDGRFMARVHEDVCASSSVLGIASYGVTKVDFLNSLGLTTTVATLTVTDNVRPHASWTSNDSLKVTVANHAVFDTLLPGVGTVKVVPAFEPPDPEDRARWMEWLKAYRSYEMQHHTWLDRKYDLHESVGPEPLPPAPYDR